MRMEGNASTSALVSWQLVKNLAVLHLPNRARPVSSADSDLLAIATPRDLGQQLLKARCRARQRSV